MRVCDRAEADYVNICNRYKAVSIRIESTILYQRKMKEGGIIGGGNVKVFYSFVNSRLQSSDKISSVKDECGNIINDSKIMANVFNKTFCKSFAKEDNLLMPPVSTATPTYSLSSILFSPSAIHAQLNKLKPSNTISPDGFSSNILRVLGDALVLPIMSLFEFFFTRNFLPSSWKIPKITPHYKKGVRSDPSNYRPIANTSIFCRLMEKNHSRTTFKLPKTK